MKKSAVVFAGYFPTPFSVLVGKEFIDYFAAYFSDCHFYVGLNQAECNEQFVALLAQSGLSYELRIAPSELTLNSDASAYQAALAQLRDSCRTDFDYIYLFHSKGATNVESKKLRDHFLPRFANRSHVEAVLDMDRIGSYSLFLSKSKLRFEDQLSEYFPFERPYFFTYLYFHTIYAFRAQPVLDFVYGCKAEFFNTNLKDRYFFERDFPHAIWRQGYAPFGDFIVNWNDGFPAGEVDLNSDIAVYLGRPLNFRY